MNNIYVFTFFIVILLYLSYRDLRYDYNEIENNIREKYIICIITLYVVLFLLNINPNIIEVSIFSFLFFCISLLLKTNTGGMDYKLILFSIPILYQFIEGDVFIFIITTSIFMILFLLIIILVEELLKLKKEGENYRATILFPLSYITVYYLLNIEEHPFISLINEIIYYITNIINQLI